MIVYGFSHFSGLGVGRSNLFRPRVANIPFELFMGSFRQRCRGTLLHKVKTDMFLK